MDCFLHYCLLSQCYEWSSHYYPCHTTVSLEICALLDGCIPQNGYSVPTFRDDPSIPFARNKKSRNISTELHSMLRNIPEEHRSQLLKSHILCHLFTACKSVTCLVQSLHTAEWHRQQSWSTGHQQRFLSTCDQSDCEPTRQERFWCICDSVSIQEAVFLAIRIM